ncbi:hypothetical protein ACQYWQ_00060 [Streptomyces sp. P6-2-1]|uniref:hypothetical protein n=1 Tax=unclassified Streptomyces TaxID=2593676 RepID=UPI003D35F88C
MVKVREYWRGGTKVRAHTRLPPGARKQLTIALVAVAAVFVFSHTGPATEASEPRRPSTNRSTPPPAPARGKEEPRPGPSWTVTYPIPWDRDGS